MHLLDTTTKQLKTFYGENIPKYAILSHMWGAEEDEVLFRHIAGSDDDKHEGEMRKGYAKIEGACKQATKDGWEYIWIDTCCIDKGSSAELSEAINSMYMWYRHSDACYVYLEDVRSNWDGQSGGDEGATFPIVPFGRSRWFSRGWTLQELIAPRYVVFFSKDWVDIGTKTSLQDAISVVTRIRAEMLTAYDSRRASVAEKMSWAAFRETTRAEDAAYCLMGLLGVNMPLLYGEGDRAFRRLQEEFMKASDDDSLFAWKSRLDDYDHLDNPRGMLAKSPWEFRDGMNIVRSNEGAYSPYSMTNQGLKIKLPLLPADFRHNLIDIDFTNIYKTTLKCTIGTRRIVIYLKKIREGYYQRVFPHWFNEKEICPNEIGLTSLLIPQIDASMTHDRPEIENIKVEILPTESGFTTEGQSLVEGYKDPPFYPPNSHQLISFERQGKCLVVEIILDKSSPRLGFKCWEQRLDYDSSLGEYMKTYHYLYGEEGSGYNDIAQYLDQLSKKIPGEDWWVTASVRKTGCGQNHPCFRAIIDVQREPIRAIPYLMPTSDRFSGDFTNHRNYHSIHPDFKKESHDWFAVFNPEVRKVLDISLVYALVHEWDIRRVQFSHDGKYLVTVSDLVRVYDMETGVEKFTFKDEYISSLCFSPDSKFLATGGDFGYVTLWNIGEKRIHKIFNGHQDAVISLCFSSDARLIISGSTDGTFRTWEITDGVSRILDIGFEYKIFVSISPNGSLVVTRSSNSTICIWDIATIQQLAELRSEGDEDFAYVTFTPDGRGLMSGSTNNTLKYWDISELIPTEVKTNRECSSDPGALNIPTTSRRNINKTSWRTMTFTGHEGDIILATVPYSERWVISGSSNGSVLFWDLGNASAQFMLKTRSISGMSSVGNMFATIHDGGVRVWRYEARS